MEDNLTHWIAQWTASEDIVVIDMLVEATPYSGWTPNRIILPLNGIPFTAGDTFTIKTETPAELDVQLILFIIMFADGTHKSILMNKVEEESNVN